MKPQDLANLLTPLTQEACERGKEDMLASLPRLKRMAVKSCWGPLMRHGVPFALRVGIEVLIAKYRRAVEPVIGDYVRVLLPLLEETHNPDLQQVKDLIDLFQTPAKDYHPVVRDCLDPSLSHPAHSYDDSL